MISRNGPQPSVNAFQGALRIALSTHSVVTLSVAASLFADPSEPVLSPEAAIHGVATAAETVLALELAAGDFARIRVAQDGVDLTLALYGPGGDVLAERDSPTGKTGLEELSVVTSSGGRHRLFLRRSESEAAGRFTARLAVRKATASDHLWARAEASGYEALIRSMRRAQTEREAAIEGWRQTADLWRRLREPGREAAAYSKAARGAVRLRRHEQAIELYDASLAACQVAGDKHEMARVLNNFGSTLHKMNRLEEARGRLEQALELWRRLDDLPEVARTLNNLGLIQRDRGQNLVALELLARALELRRQGADRLGEARTLTNLGILWRELGEPQRSIDAYREALDIWTELGKSLKRNERRDQAATLNSLGAIHRGLGNFGRARDYYFQALVLNRQLGARDREARTLYNLGWLHHLEGEPALARHRYDQAQTVSIELHDLTVHAAIHNGLGRLQTETGAWTAARQSFEAALTTYRELERDRGTAFALQGLAELEWRAGHLGLAKSYLEEALGISGLIGDLPAQAAQQIRLARIEAARGDLERALTLGRQSLEVVEALRGDVIRPDLRAAFTATRRGYYETQIDLLVAAHRADPAAGHDAEAFETSERARARSLLETLKAVQVEPSTGVDASLLRHEDKLGRQLNADGLRLLGLSSSSASPVEIAAFKRRIDERLEEYRSLRAQIKHMSPNHAALTQPEPLAVREIQRSLLGDDDLILEYALGKERSYLWAVTADSLDVFELPPGRHIENLSRHLHQALTARSRGAAGGERGAADNKAQGLAQELSRIVLAPVARLLRDHRLLIVPDGALQYVPFAALPAPCCAELPEAPALWFSTPLVARHELVVLPSISTLGVLRREWARRERPTESLAIWADPVFSRWDTRLASRNSSGSGKSAATSVRGIDLRDGTFARLTSSAAEAAAIADLAPGARIFEGLLATRQSLEEASDYGILHFATHGVVDTDHPELSGLILSMLDEHGHHQDGFLRLHDIYNLMLNSELVVLSACRTALGKEIRGEGLISLTRGFLHAGARRVVASLWDVEDRATAELMEHFYRQLLLQDRPPAAALRQAQLSMAREGHWRSPYYWAGFVLQGEWRATRGTRVADG